MSQESNFKVLWADVSYKVKPYISFSDVCDGFSQSTRRCVNSVLKSGKRKTYEFNPASTKEAVTILHNVSGSFRSGELTAVMGPSGAGKTSLLNLIARRSTKGYSGRYFMQGPDQRVKISTIPQNDYLPQYLTVRENLLFASRLKNMAKGFDHEQVVADVVKVLDLERCVDTMTNRTSGGQQKRVSIAQELVSKPDILILDEPTSGLDSLTCYKTIEVLKNFVKMPSENPIAIVLTIHQPEHYVFSMFDKVYALAPGGVAIYNGPPRECAEFIRKHSGLRIPDDDYNPASFLIEIAGNEFGQEPIEVLQRQVKLDYADEQRSLFPKSGGKLINNMTKKLGLIVRFNESEHKISSATTTLDIDRRLNIGSSIDSGHFWKKTLTLSHRYFVSLTRDPKQLFASLLLHLMVPFVIVVIIGQEPGRANACPRIMGPVGLRELAMDEQLTSEDMMNELERTTENVASIFISAFSVHTFSSGIAALSFTLDMLSSLKEYHNSWYSIHSYILARIITDLPFTIIVSALSTSLSFYMSGQTTNGDLSFIKRALLANISVILGSVGAKALGMIFAAIFMGQVITSLFASQAAFMPLVLVSGFLVRPKNMGPYIYMISQTSLIKHNLDLFLLARYGFNTCQCKPSSVKQAEITGVPDQLKAATQYFMSEMEDSSATDINGTTMTDKKDDMFQLFAEQISSFNTYGRKITDCRQVQPHEMFERSLNDEDLVPILVKLSLVVLSMILLLFVTVKLVVNHKTSL